MAHGGPVDGSYVDIGSGALVTTGDVAGRICSIADTGVSPELGAVPDRAMEQVRRANVDATEAGLGWTAGTDLDNGLATTYQWYRDLSASGSR
jgi:nucleoside-diphosphate-sugar epimerase